MFFALMISAILGMASCTSLVIRNLIGEPDYHQVNLRWEADANSPSFHGFQVKYCELQSWGAHRCRLKEVTENPATPNGEKDGKSYMANVNGLRMATTYSFEVKEQGEREDRADEEDKNQNIIVIPTKGFSARATQCLPHASEIEVATGPYFGGRIAVEAADGERCALDGDPNSARDTYILRINHKECGSQVNETTVATFVIVQENLPILTHSTRRFLVLCSYQPETLTVRAGLNLPTGISGRGQAHSAGSFEDGSNSLRRGRNMRNGRFLQAPQALVKEESFEEQEPEDNSFPIAIITMLSIAGVIGIVAIAIKLTRKNILPEMDNVSIGSDISISSCSTTADVETANHPDRFKVRN